jgi:hypothetical protein
MQTIYRTLLAGAAAMAAGTSLAATPIDTQQKLASATQQGISFIRSQPGRLSVLTDAAREYIEKPLADLAAATTPAALAGTQDGLTMPCATSGSIAARVTRSLPRVLKLEWNACAFLDSGGFPRQRDGSGEIGLLSNSFAPRNVGGIRLGSATADFIDERHSAFPEMVTHERRTLNLRIVGVIPVKRAFVTFGVFSGPFAYDVVGFHDEVDTYEFPGGEFPPHSTHNRIIAEHVFATGDVGYRGENNQQYTSDISLLWGELSFSIFDLPPLDERRTVSRFAGLRLREDYDFMTFTSALSIDGKIDHLPMPWLGSENDGCFAGERVYRTRAPLRGPAFDVVFTSGELAVNNSSTLFYSAASVPSSQPVPSQGYMVRLDVRNTGPVYYDTASQFDTLRHVGECLFPQ